MKFFLGRLSSAVLEKFQDARIHLTSLANAEIEKGSLEISCRIQKVWSSKFSKRGGVTKGNDFIMFIEPRHWKSDDIPGIWPIFF